MENLIRVLSDRSTDTQFRTFISRTKDEKFEMLKADHDELKQVVKKLMQRIEKQDS